MQTFLPYADFEKSAHVLDRQRLGKQRIETKQLIRTIELGGGWANHPAAKMWRGYVPALAEYGRVVCLEWRARGYVDEQLNWFKECLRSYTARERRQRPPWLGSKRFHLSHRSNLLRKMPEHYRQFWPNVPDNLPYIWP